MTIYSEVYEKYCNGDHITDEELTVAIPFFRKLADDLFAAGPTFKIAAKEADRVAFTLEGYQKARKEG